MSEMEPHLAHQQRRALKKQVFISYSHEDRAFVQKLKKDLEFQNLQVVLDQEHFLIGDRLSDAVSRAVSTADYIVVVLSKSSVASNWVQEEIGQAHTRQLNEGTRLLLPVIIDGCSTPDTLKDKIQANFQDPGRYREELEKLIRSMEQEPTAVPDVAKARPWWQLAAVVLAVGLAALSAGLLWKLQLDRHRGPISVAVRDFECDGAGYGFAAGLSEMLTAALSFDQDLRVIDRQLVLEAEQDLKLSHLQKNDEPEHFQRNLDTDFLISGSCGAGGSPEITVRLVLTPSSGRPAFRSEPYLGSPRDPAFLVAQLAGEIRGRLGTSRTSLEQDAELLQRLFPRDPEALARYFEGLARLERPSFNKSEEAKDVLETVAGEKAHPKILRLLAVALWDLGDDAAAGTARAAEKAARELNFPLRDQLEITSTRAIIEGDLKAKIWAYKELHEKFPWELHYGLSLADAQGNAGDVAASLNTLSDLRRQWSSPAALARIDFCHADLLHSQGRYREAATVAEHAAAEARAASSPSVGARVDLVLAQIDAAMGRHAAAKERLDRALPVFQAGHDRFLETCRELLAIESFALGEALPLEQLRKDYENDPAGEGRVLYLAGQVAVEGGDYKAAEGLFQQALGIFRSLRDRVSEVDVLAERAFLFFAWGRPEEAAHYADQAFSIYNDLKKADGMATALEMLSEFEYYQGRLDCAENHQQAALAEHHRAGNSEGEAFSKYLMGMIYAQNRNPVARTYLQAGVSEQQHPLYLAEARLGLSFFETIEGFPKEGLKLADQAAKDLASAKWTWRDEQVRLARIRALLAQGEIDSAAAELKAFQSAARGKDFRVLYEAGILTARVNAGSGRPEDREPALASLTKIAQDARRAGYLLYEMEAQLAHGEILLQAGEVKAAREELKTLASKAEKAGLARFVERAEKALGVKPGTFQLQAAEPRPQVTPPLHCET